MQRFFHSRSFIELENLISQPGARKSARMAGMSAGFTIVELLIVIVIIGILAAIVIVAYSGITQRASASAIADGLKGFEKAMRLYATENAYSAWPDETTIIGGTTPTLPALIANAPGFKNYIQAAPNVSGILATAWRYDNDSDTYSGCSTGAQGANIFIANLTDGDMAQRVDDIMDDGNLSCGKVRWNASTNLMYSLSNNSAL